MDDQGAADGDPAIERWRANMTSGRHSLGGHLSLTARTLSFRPHLIDRATGGKSSSVDLGSVSGVSIAELGSNALDGSLRRRICISTSTDKSYFVVPKPDAVASRIKEGVSE